jgi:hypothetical protein
MCRLPRLLCIGNLLVSKIDDWYVYSDGLFAPRDDGRVSDPFVIIEHTSRRKRCFSIPLRKPQVSSRFFLFNIILFPSLRLMASVC